MAQLEVTQNDKNQVKDIIKYIKCCVEVMTHEARVMLALEVNRLLKEDIDKARKVL